MRNSYLPVVQTLCLLFLPCCLLVYLNERDKARRGRAFIPEAMAHVAKDLHVF